MDLTHTSIQSLQRVAEQAEIQLTKSRRNKSENQVDQAAVEPDTIQTRLTQGEQLRLQDKEMPADLELEQQQGHMEQVQQAVAVEQEQQEATVQPLLPGQAATVETDHHLIQHGAQQHQQARM
jgi:hypothetical protein